MKKLLATLIVAAMLISCMSVIVFADGSTIYTDTVFAGSVSFVDHTDKVKKFTNEVAAEYFNYLGEIYDDGDGVDLSDTLFRAMYAAKDDKDEDLLPGAASFPYKFTEGEYVAVPIYVTNVSSVGIYAEYNTSVLTPVGTAGKYLKTTSEVQSGRYFATGAAGADGDQTGLFDVIFFKVNSGLTGDANGEATTTVTLSFTASTGGNPGKANPAEGPAGTIGNDTITINLTGLTPGGSKPEKVTTDGDVKVADVMTAADTSTFSPEATADAATLSDKATAGKIKAGGDKAENTLPDDLTGVKYTVSFGTANFGAVTTAPDEFGFALYEGDTLKGLYKAENAFEGKFGILFFGLKDGVTYTTKSYVKYDGEAAIIAQ